MRAEKSKEMRGGARLSRLRSRGVRWRSYNGHGAPARFVCGRERNGSSWNLVDAKRRIEGEGNTGRRDAEAMGAIGAMGAMQRSAKEVATAAGLGIGDWGDALTSPQLRQGNG